MTAAKRTILGRIAALFVALLFAVVAGGCASAQSQPQPRGWSRAELEQLLAPVALYPDALLAQLLIAATYPDEIVTAARWSRMHPELSGEDAVRAADAFDWDPSVKSLLAFPGLLQRMDERIDWTRALGDAVLAQEADVMDAVQALRGRARIAGALASDDYVHVADDGPRIRIVFASPPVVYLPYYDPRVVYGHWAWPANPPVVWAPWPGYRFVPRARGVAVGFWWSSGVRLSVGFFYGDIDWPRREVRVVRVDTWYVHRAIERRAPQRVVVLRPGRWHHEPTRRHAGYRPAPRPQHAREHSAPPREARRPEARPPENRRPQARQPESPRRDARAQEPRQPEARRPYARQPEARSPEARHVEARERAPSPPQADPPREARRRDVERPQAREAQREARRTQPQRDARVPEPRRETQANEERPAPKAQ
ncbi:MAG: DUF3300 domain-containing protein, partial [Burkholderiales bacterium]|nr:DUF3300 domain-containing protein [Burkholderiales bacterium]